MPAAHARLRMELQSRLRPLQVTRKENHRNVHRSNARRMATLFALRYPLGVSKAQTYVSYLALDQVLSAQQPRSEEHDEMLFIIVHQVYELWFKELLHELTFLQRRLESGHTAHALATLKRILTILKTVVAQVDVLETLTPTQFTAVLSRLNSGRLRQPWVSLANRCTVA